MKILILDTYYLEFLKSLPFGTRASYDANLQALLNHRFGTFDAYSRNLRTIGWEAVDVVVNSTPLQALWAIEHGMSSGDVIRAQIQHHRPDVVFLQDLGIPVKRGSYLLAGQCSCPLPSESHIRKMDLLFTSFPHYVDRLSKMGVPRVEYLPLAFDPIVLDGDEPVRDIDISFVGGVGRDSHWRSGTDTLEIIAREFQTRFHWYGYGLDRLPKSSVLRACYRGEAWGRKQYEIYRRSKIVINRHGEVAQGFANNLRMYEATGCGAMLVTDNVTDLFGPGEIVPYANASEAVERIHFFLANDTARRITAERGLKRTIKDHTYAKRMKVVSDVLTEVLCPD